MGSWRTAWVAIISTFICSVALAEPPHVNDSVLISFNDAEVFSAYLRYGNNAALEKAKGLLAGTGLRDPKPLMATVDVKQGSFHFMTVWKLPAEAVGAVPQVAAILSKLPGVERAEPDYILTIDATPNDPQYGNAWGLSANSNGIDAPAAWDRTTGSANTVIAVIDTGVDYNHPDLAPNIWRNPSEIAGNGIDDDQNGFVDDIYGADFVNNDGDPMDDHNHGTHCAGTIGAAGNNGIGVPGVNWQVKIMALKFMDASGSGSTSSAMSALNYAVNKGVKISSNSWGGGANSSFFYSALQAANNAGHIFVAAAGNSSTNIDTSPYYPASYPSPNVVTVAAIDSSGNLASFSNYGATTVDLAAPGVSILSTLPGNTYGYYSGTSMATPHVAGALGLMLSVRAASTVSELTGALLDGSKPLASLSGKTLRGSTLSANGALARLGSGQADTTPPSVALIAPTQGQSVTGVVPASCSASDSGGIARVDFVVNGLVRSSDNSSPYEFMWDTTVENAGTITVRCEAYDSSFNKASSADASVTVIRDSTPPSSVTITAPKDGATVVSGTTIDYSATAVDDIGVSKVEFYVDGKLLVTDNAFPFSTKWKVPKVSTRKGSSQSLPLYVVAFDGAGNSTRSSTIQVTISAR